MSNPRGPQLSSDCPAVGQDKLKKKKQKKTIRKKTGQQLLKHAVFLSVCLPETVRDTFLVDPAVILIVVGVVMFFITFCGCIGALRENIRLLKTVKVQPGTLLQRLLMKAIVHYRDDLDLQNLMDYIQKEFKCCGWNSYTDWSWNLYFNCTRENPSTERCAVPYSCCTPVPGETVINTMCGFGVQTQKYLDANKSIYPVGCADRAVMWIETHLLLVGALTLGLALPQVRKPRHTCRVCMGGRTSRRHQKGLTACWRSRAPTE
uniref:Tetraspanin-33 n=1 Tax=Oryzias sinensis TaxID=183150 RepID=A0A8C7XRN5_9TELE